MMHKHSDCMQKKTLNVISAHFLHYAQSCVQMDGHIRPNSRVEYASKKLVPMTCLPSMSKDKSVFTCWKGLTGQWGEKAAILAISPTTCLCHDAKLQNNCQKGV